MSESLELLWAWTPFLLTGFYWNIVIAVLATVIGTGIGALLALMRLSSSRLLAGGAGVVISFFRNVPSLVLLFYAATFLPNELSLWGSQVPLPDWLKAALALSGSPIGFTALNLHSSLLQWRRNERGAAMLFFPNWLGGFMITVLASSTASLVGVNELVGRCNTVIAASSTIFMFPVYVYALCLFFAFCYPFSLVLGNLKNVMEKRYS